eukprot:TCONS_00072711-protein
MSTRKSTRKSTKKQNTGNEENDEVDDVIEKKLWIHEKSKEYSSSLSIHGLSRTIHTDSHLERIFWMISLMLAVGIAFLMVQSLLIKFWNQDVYINTESRVTSKNYFPSVTFCLEEITVKDTYCEYPANDDLHGALTGRPEECTTGRWWGLPKLRIPNNVFELNAQGMISIVTLPLQTFFVNCPWKGVCLNKDMVQKNFKPLVENELCLTWNPDGEFYNLKNRLELNVKINHNDYRGKGKGFVAYVHHHTESPISSERKIPLSDTLNTEISFKKIVKVRKKRGNPQSCEDNYYNNSKNIFPGRYTVEACLDSYTCIQSLMLCGDSMDFCKDYLPTQLLEKYWMNTTYEEVYSCMRKSYNEGLFYADGAVCLPPCQETQYQVSSTVSAPGTSLVTLMYPERNIYEYQEEKEVYTWEDFIAGIGGMVGLFCGFSILSIAELFVYIGLKCVFKCRGTANQGTDGNVEAGDTIKGRQSAMKNELGSNKGHTNPVFS